MYWNLQIYFSELAFVAFTEKLHTTTINSPQLLDFFHLYLLFQCNNPYMIFCSWYADDTQLNSSSPFLSHTRVSARLITDGSS